MQKWRLVEGSEGMLEENSPFLEPEAWTISDNFTTLDIKHLSIYHTLQVLDLNSTSQLAGRTYFAASTRTNLNPFFFSASLSKVSFKVL